MGAFSQGCDFVAQFFAGNTRNFFLQGFSKRHHSPIVWHSTAPLARDLQADIFGHTLRRVAFLTTPGMLLEQDMVQGSDHKITDPACGSGGFLLGAFQYIVTHLAIQAETKDLAPDEDGFVRTWVAAAFDVTRQAILSETLWGYV